MEEEITEWALDSEEEFEDALYADAEIPDEANKVRELVRLVPEGTDRKFDTLVRAIEEIRREFPKEKFLIFTQYRETLEFLNEELGKLYGSGTSSLLHGGPLEDKIEAVEKFWDPEGARFLISTSAGGEGINLQVCRVMFNYDLPWNPMAVEQRIGRLHRFGQHETVQVYNLVAEDTVEERIYFLLEEKLREIAQTIGKVDERGDVVEDFRSEILGFLGSSPNYQELYKRALVNRDYRRTEVEIAEALQRAREASEALRALTQDLDSFNLEHYRHLQGQFTLADLRKFTEKSIVRMGGAFVPLGDETYRIDTPPSIREQSRGVLLRYDAATFDRDVAMRRKRVEFMGLGHPLVDALLAHLKSPVWRGEVSRLSCGDKAMLSVRWLVSVRGEEGKIHQRYHHVALNDVGSARRIDERNDLNLLPILANMQQKGTIDATKLQAFAEAEFQGVLAKLRAAADGRPTIRGELVGLAYC